MKIVIIALSILAVVFVIGMNTGMICDKTAQWVEANPKHESAPKYLFRAARWANLLGDYVNAEKLYRLLYEKYPQENALVAEGLFHIAEMREQGASRLSSLDYCQIIMDQYPQEEKWRVQASKLYDQVKNNVR